MDSSSTDAKPQTRIHQQKVVAEIGQRALETDDLDRLMYDATVAVAETLDTDCCHVLELLPNARELVLRQGVGWNDGIVGNAIVPTARDSQAGYTLLSQEPVVVGDLSTEDRFTGNDLLVDHHVTSGITVIIGSVREPWGVLGTFTTEQRAFTEHDAHFVQNVANTLASAIKNEETQSELEEIYGRISDAFFALDEDWNFTHLNDRAHKLINPDEHNLTGENIWELFPAATERDFRPKYEQAMYEQETVDFEEYYPEPLDAWFEVRAYPSETGLSVYFRDVTERIEREKALKESKNQLQALIELLPVAIFVAEADGEIVEWNEAAEEIWGGEIVESDSIAEYDRYDGWWADTGEPVEPAEWALARALRGEEVTDPDVIEIVGFDGQRRTVLNFGMPVRDADGEVTRAVVTLIDITDRNEYQRKLEESNERLEQFAYAASHDLQEPLRMVTSYLQLVEQRYAADLDEDGREFIEFAVDGADRMRAMIEGLLEYSRVDAQGDPFEPVDLNDVLADVRKDLQVKIEEIDAEITAEDLPQVYGDSSQLSQVFQNLLDNAIEYSGDESPEIDISAERTGAEWVASVSDAGIGIEPDDTDRVFQVFQRLHNRDEHTGTGIGLALVERIVERHGGDIWVDSEPGEGSTFSFTLPRMANNDT